MKRENAIKIFEIIGVGLRNQVKSDYRSDFEIKLCRAHAVRLI